MPGKLSILLLMSILRIHGIVFAQHAGLPQQQTEDFLYSDELAEVPVEIYEAYTDLLGKPLNINTASPDQLGESGLFSPYQIHNLIKYRNKFGSLYSVYELAAVTGFRLSRVQEMAHYLTVENSLVQNHKIKKRHLIIINLGQNLPESAAYLINTKTGGERAYAGSPLKTSIRIKSQIGQNLSVGLTYEKDAGDQFFKGTKPEFISGYICYKGNRHMKQLVLGNFQLNHGVGLVNGSGFIHSPESIRVNRQSLSRIRPYASKSETGYERGMGCMFDLKLFDLLMWTSYRKMDLSLGNLSEDPGEINWWKYWRNTGLHRTTNELKGRNLGYRFHSGVQALYKNRNLDVGLMLGIEGTGLSRQGTDSLKVYKNPNIYNTCSVHGNWQRDRLQIFGELATGNWNSSAILLGATCNFNDFLMGRLILHNYGPAYRGSQPSSYASGSKIENELGVALHLHVEPGSLLTADFTGELFSYPGPRHLTAVPSSGYRYSITFRNTGKSEFQWKVRIMKKEWQTTPDNEHTGLRTLQNSEVTRFDFRFIYENLIQWQSRLILSLLTQGNEPVPAYAIVQQLSFHTTEALKYVIQFVVFNVKDWENRIYLYEPGLYYSFSFPSYYGSGQKINAVLTIKPIRKLTLAGKIAIITYQNKEFIGSGNDLIMGNIKWELGIQVRLNL